MSRKDFELIAETIRFATCLDATSRLAMAEEFARQLVRTNSRFNADRFIRACLPSNA